MLSLILVDLRSSFFCPAHRPPRPTLRSLTLPPLQELEYRRYIVYLSPKSRNQLIVKKQTAVRRGRSPRFQRPPSSLTCRAGTEEEARGRGLCD